MDGIDIKDTENKNENKTEDQKDVENIKETKGTTSTYNVTPKQVKWNWGAAMLPIYFGFGCHSWLCILAIIPIFNIIWWPICGLCGAKWAWKSKYFKSEDEFNKTMKTWNTAGLATLIIKIASLIIIVILSDFILGMIMSCLSVIGANFGIEKVVDVIVAIIKAFLKV